LDLLDLGEERSFLHDDVLPVQGSELFDEQSSIHGIGYPNKLGYLDAADCPTLVLMTLTTQNKAIVSDFIGALFTRGDPKAVDDYLAEDFVNHDPPFGAGADREGMRTAGTMFRSAFPDWHSDLHMLVAEDDIVVELFTASGSHTGSEIMGVPASGRTVVLPGINIFRLRDGQIVERWGRMDDLNFLRQVGAIEVP
jgi:steroid delta-isomerase-like uncharacterized protein